MERQVATKRMHEHGTIGRLLVTRLIVRLQGSQRFVAWPWPSG